MRENQVVGVSYNVESETVTWTFGHGLPNLTLNLKKVHPAIVRQAALYGMGQVRVRDRAAIGKADKNGAIIPAKTRAQTMRERMAALVQFYETGAAQWSPDRVARVAPVDEILVAALLELFPKKTEDEIRAFLRDQGAEHQKALSASETVKDVYRRIQEERIAPVAEGVEEALSKFVGG